MIYCLQFLPRALEKHSAYLARFLCRTIYWRQFRRHRALCISFSAGPWRTGLAPGIA